jgi:hypothetical protein
MPSTEAGNDKGRRTWRYVHEKLVSSQELLPSTMTIKIFCNEEVKNGPVGSMDMGYTIIKLVSLGEAV